ncbi:Multiple antibiotic resistance protein MarR [Zhongshania aliphaticivorans]|uniref:Multiple antibiotic resistance protein MarR n=1 Tax=Zhongshania aliphaticivorans TaxID=1470434 RepID=A0A5S9MTC6_9GAMM|nr:MarR family transcriptional regulator [Zhongshania aliphaticivorans]CAA0080465.1 Multiple antibiotic resistance protein MarR [Zhongshania aliphaticivorans]CAA0085718.1 Multiple antibiotic resistance protein MarR [Zhongshania aliphaticivorans]
MSVTPLNEILHNLTHAYKSSIATAVKSANIPLPITHVRALKGIRRDENVTAQAIAKRMRRDKAQITRVLNELLKDEFIIKLNNPNDGRSQILRLTEKGQGIVEQLDIIEAHSKRTMTQKLSDDDIQQFIRIANAMISNLSNEASNSEDNSQ